MNRPKGIITQSWKSNMRRTMKGIAVLSAWLAASISSAQATSFDCAKAQNYAEKTICSSAELQGLDEDLNSEYVRTIDRVPAKVKADVRQSQRDWLKQRNACTTAGCISAAMAEQIQTLSHWGAGMPAAPVLKPATASSPAPAAARPATVAPTTSAVEEFDIKRGASVASTLEALVPTTKSAEQEQHGSSQPSLDMQPFKIALVAMMGLLVVCIWLHSRGSMDIYTDYTDALWTTLTPVLSVGTYFLARWLDVSVEAAGWSALAVLSLMSLQILIQTYRSNGLSLYFILALYAKVVLFTLFMFLMALLMLGGSGKADRRRRRGWAVAAGALFAFFTAWMCRNRQFSHIDDYLTGRA